jgi:hypothetical protein
MSLYRFELALCELYNPRIHGIPDKNKKETPVLNYYLLLLSFSQPWKKGTWNEVEACTKLHRHKYKEFDFLDDVNTIFRNYHHMTLPKNIYSVVSTHIVERIQIGEYVVAVIKTFWIRWIQRVWKRVFRERLAIVKSLGYLASREKDGKITNLPSLRGMLCLRS